VAVTDLTSLRGPAHGTAELSLRLFWTNPDSSFDLHIPFMRRWLTRRPATQRTCGPAQISPSGTPEAMITVEATAAPNGGSRW
jgi:hypothetical protein